MLAVSSVRPNSKTGSNSIRYDLQERKLACLYQLMVAMYKQELEVMHFSRLLT